MAFIRTVKRENPFVQLDKTFIEDNNLSWKSKGLMSYLLSRPNDWKINHRDLVRRSTDGQRAVTSALKELQTAGYIHYYNQKDENGLFNGWIYDVYERPEFNPAFIEEQKEEQNEEQTPPIVEEPLADFPQMQNEDMQNVDMQNEDMQNGDYTNNDCTNNKFTNNKLNKYLSIPMLTKVENRELRSFLIKKTDRLTDNDILIINDLFLEELLPIRDFKNVVGEVLAQRQTKPIKNLSKYLRSSIKNYISSQQQTETKNVKRDILPKWLREEQNESSDTKPTDEEKKLDKEQRETFEELMKWRDEQKKNDKYKNKNFGF